MKEVELLGGVANAGAVVRIGEHVLRPRNPHSDAIHRFLISLRSTGFDGAPEPVGFDANQRERLTFIPGDVPMAPYPAWAQSDATLQSCTVLLREFHQASRAFDPSTHRWSGEMSDPSGGPIVCHNDVCLENIVFRDGIAVGLLDFDFAAPGRPAFDIATFAKMCVPIDDEVNAARNGWGADDRPSRLRLVMETYGLSRAGRQEVFELLSQSMATGRDFVRRRVLAGDVNVIKMWHEMGGESRFVRRRDWWQTNREIFQAAISCE